MNTGRTNDTYILWGAPASLYTGKARSYLIKKRIPYREFFPSHAVYQAKIAPALGFFVVPVLEAPDGSIIQDTSDIIEHLEEKFPEPCFNPSTPPLCRRCRRTCRGSASPEKPSRPSSARMRNCSTSLRRTSCCIRIF